MMLVYWLIMLIIVSCMLSGYKACFGLLWIALYGSCVLVGLCFTYIFIVYIVWLYYVYCYGLYTVLGILTVCCFTYTVNIYEHMILFHLYMLYMVHVNLLYIVQSYNMQHDMLVYIYLVHDVIMCVSHAHMHTCILYDYTIYLLDIVWLYIMHFMQTCILSYVHSVSPILCAYVS